MNEIYVMQRANKDLFAFDDHGRFGVPLFRTRHDAMIARSRNVEMLLFKPVALDAGLLSELETGRADVDLWLINDPLLSPKRGCLIEQAQLALLMSGPLESRVVSDMGRSSDPPLIGTFVQSSA